jgi:hypothetical protein
MKNTVFHISIFSCVLFLFVFKCIKDYEEIPDKIKSGVWAKDSFIFTSTGNKLNFCVGNLVECICHLEKYEKKFIHLLFYLIIFLLSIAIRTFIIIWILFNLI